MFDFAELKTLHIELTTRCQASCPMCARNYHGGMENPNLSKSEITFQNFQKIVGGEIISLIEYIYFCGNFGDPILSNHLIDIVKYCRQVKPSLRIGIHTNGGARNKDWWEKLADVLPEDHCVHFALDGLEDTHSLYRKGTDFKKILENATTFIKAGGKAEWVYLSFKHNEHQIDQAKKMAHDLGFKFFNHKATSRFLEKPWLDVLDEEGKMLYKIEPPSEHRITFIHKDVILNYQSIVDTTDISCRIQKEKSLYIDSSKHLWPCCWLAALPYTYSKPEDLIHQYQTSQTTVINELVNSMGGYDSIDLLKHSIKEILSRDQWKTSMTSYWQAKKLATCTKTCGVFKEKILTQYQDQFLSKASF